MVNLNQLVKIASSSLVKRLAGRATTSTRKPSASRSSSSSRSKSQSGFYFPISVVSSSVIVFGYLASFFGDPVPPNPSDPNHPSEPSTQVVVQGGNQGAHTNSPNWMPRDRIIMGSFNIQTLGRSKLQRPEVVDVLVNIIQRFDLLAVQELRDNQEGTIPQLLDFVNAKANAIGSHYQAVVSPPLKHNDSNYSEQLVYLYDSTHIELIAESYVAQDPSGRMARPPYVAQFRYRSNYPQESFSFLLVNVHTSPERNQNQIELVALEELLSDIRQRHPYEDDIILLGDLNAEPAQFNTVRWFDHQTAAVPSHWKTNTRGTKNYDNLVFDIRRTAEFTGQSGVFDLKTTYQLPMEQALQVSDHMPVWAVFSTREVNSRTLTQQEQVIR